jgi:hypothetical protein
MGRRRSSILSSFLVIALAGSSAHPQAQAPCIRAADSGINMLVERGLTQSPTFRRLYEQLGQSDLIVHLERGPQPWLGAGFNQFVAEVGDRRFLRITLNVAQLDADAVALLGHELQHAVELADAPDVEDHDGYERLYRRIGYRSCSREPRCFDTVAAVAVGRAVLKELRQRSGPISSLARAGGGDDETRQRPVE